MDKNRCRLGRYGAIAGCVRAARTMRTPTECAANETRGGDPNRAASSPAATAGDLGSRPPPRGTNAPDSRSSITSATSSASRAPMASMESTPV